MNASTITVSSASDFKVSKGDKISMRVPVYDENKLRRFWHWVLRRPPPIVYELVYYEVGGDDQSGMLYVREWPKGDPS